MQAEALLCQNLLGGFVLLTFLNTNFSVALIKGCGIGCRTLISVILEGPHYIASLPISFARFVCTTSMSRG